MAIFLCKFSRNETNSRFIRGKGIGRTHEHYYTIEMSYFYEATARICPMVESLVASAFGKTLT
jgi:hypothetical protein